MHFSYFYNFLYFISTIFMHKMIKYWLWWNTDTDVRSEGGAKQIRISEFGGNVTSGLRLRLETPVGDDDHGVPLQYNKKLYKNPQGYSESHIIRPRSMCFARSRKRDAEGRRSKAPPGEDEALRMRWENTERHDRSKGVRRQCFRGSSPT